MSVPQSAPAVGGEPAPLRRKFSGYDEKVANLMQKFPGVREDAIRQELQNVGGHASKARNAIQKKYGSPPATPSGGGGAVSPAASPAGSPEPVSKEPTAAPPTSPKPLAPPRSAPALMEQPPQTAKASQPTAVGSRRGVQAAPAGKADISTAAMSKRGVRAAPAGKADTGRVNTFLASLSRSELKKVAENIEKVLGVAPPAAKAQAVAAPRGRSVEKKKQGASCFKMLTHICAADGAKGAKAQMRADALGR